MKTIQIAELTQTNLVDTFCCFLSTSIELWLFAWFILCWMCHIVMVTEVKSCHQSWCATARLASYVAAGRLIESPSPLKPFQWAASAQLFQKIGDFAWSSVRSLLPIFWRWYRPAYSFHNLFMLDVNCLAFEAFATSCLNDGGKKTQVFSNINKRLWHVVQAHILGAF